MRANIDLHSHDASGKLGGQKHVNTEHTMWELITTIILVALPLGAVVVYMCRIGRGSCRT